MARPRLRVYYGPQDDVADTLPTPGARPCVNVPLSEMLPLLADAYNAGRAWLDDFAEDEVTISHDLYEVLLAYAHYRRPSA